ncbi:MAG: CapA family protein, partial [Chloroflexota bacterium]|nr:CapA family protein [Chloroflexota bacterium]
MLRRRRFLLVVSGIVVLIGVAAGTWWLTHPSADIVGQVVDMDGEPIPGVSVAFSGGGSAATGSDGRFAIASRVRGGWVTATRPGYLSRTRAAQDGDETLIRLLVDDGQTVRLLFGGDVMFGRRYYDQNDDGDRSDGLLPLGATADEHLRLLDGVAPMLADADLSIVNLETPLIADPWVDPREPRPDRFHPTKEFVFGSAPEAAVALREAGVDIVGLGNNHLYDALDAGVASTRQALLDAGYAASDFAGAGMNVDEAWRPAIREVRGQRIAVVACTTITGVEHSLTYVAGASKAGAAACEDAALASAIQRARTDADLVVAMIHGGFEYVREPSDSITHFSELARLAGAGLVIDGHPHVVGGLQAGPGGLTAWTMGNLLFDQTVWPTFASYVLRVDVRRGEVIDAYVEPIMLRGYRPVGIVGSDADWMARVGQSLSDGPWVVDDGALMLAPGPVSAAVAVPDAPTPDAHPILNLDGACLDSPPDQALVGLDEAWTGSFEDDTADEVEGGGELWNLVDPNPDRELVADAAATGRFGVRLKRAGGDSQEIILTPLHRLLVRAGDPISVLLAARGTRGADATLQMSWYNDTIGPSQQQTIVDLPVTDEWQTFRVDLQVPENGVAAEPY